MADQGISPTGARIRAIADKFDAIHLNEDCQWDGDFNELLAELRTTTDELCVEFNVFDDKDE